VPRLCVAFALQLRKNHGIEKCQLGTIRYVDMATFYR